MAHYVGPDKWAIRVTDYGGLGSRFYIAIENDTGEIYGEYMSESIYKQMTVTEHNTLWRHIVERAIKAYVQQLDGLNSLMEKLVEDYQ